MLPRAGPAVGPEVGPGTGLGTECAPGPSGLAAGCGLGNEGGRAQDLGDEAPLEAGSHLVDEGRRDGRVAALVLGRAREDERALGHGERQEEEERVLEARLACRPETSGERESRGARAEFPPQQARGERIHRSLQPIGQEGALPPRRRKGPGVEPEEIDDVEVEPPGVAHAERPHAAGGLERVLDLLGLERRHEESDEVVEGDRLPPHRLRERGECRERLLETHPGAHVAPGRREGPVILEHGSEAERPERPPEGPDVRGDRAPPFQGAQHRHHPGALLAARCERRAPGCAGGRVVRRACCRGGHALGERASALGDESHLPQRAGEARPASAEVVGVEERREAALRESLGDTPEHVETCPHEAAREHRPALPEVDGDAKAPADVLDEVGVERQVAREKGDPLRRIAALESGPDVASGGLHLPVAVGRNHERDRPIAARRGRPLGREHPAERGGQAALPPPACHEGREHLVGDVLAADEAVPGTVEEARRVHVLGVSEGDELGVTDQADQARCNQELQHGEVVDLGEDDAAHAADRARTRAVDLSGSEPLADSPLPSVTVDGAQAVEDRLISCVDTRDRTDPEALARHGPRFRHDNER